MLIKCKECGLQVSDKALVCPHCGYPIDSTLKTRRKKSNKRRRLPNGFGQIQEIKGKFLRNPFRAMVTVGKDEHGKPICKLLKPKAYFPTYNDAYQALLKYNQNPYDLDASGMTVEELYEKWTEHHFKTLKSESSERTIKGSWKYCSSLYKMRVADIRARHIKGCIEKGVAEIRGEKKTASPAIKSRIKCIFNLMLDYALEYELVDKNYARTFDISSEIMNEISESRQEHINFTEEEIKRLWKNVGVIPYIDVILIQCYSGWRPQELGLIRLENVDLDKWIFKGGMKTASGTNRSVPIHSKIRGLVQKRYTEAQELGSEYLINCADTRYRQCSLMFTYSKYRVRFCKIVQLLKLNSMHRPHDGRVHFITEAKKAGVDEYAIKYMVGHNISDITEKIYTKRDVDWLCAEIEKIP